MKHLLDLSGESAREVDRLSERAPGMVALIIAREQRALRDDVAIAYSQTLGCTVGWLVAGEGDAPSADDVLAAVARARARMPRPVGADPTCNDFVGPLPTTRAA